ASPDRARRSGVLRDATTFLPVAGDPARGEEAIRTFNAGVILIGGDLLTREVQEALLAEVKETDWSRVRSGHTDQYVLNRVFRGRWRPLPERFNRFIAPEGSKEIAPEGSKEIAPEGSKEGVDGRLADAVFLHFVGRPK